LAEDGSLFNRLRALFLRYASHHEARACGVGLPRYRWRRVGNLETVCQVGDGLRLTGWASVAQLRVSWPDGSMDIRPDLPRPDVRGRKRPARGFDVTLPRHANPIRLAALLPSGVVRHVEVQNPAEPRTPRMSRRLRTAFVRDLLRALPGLVGYALRRSEADREAVKTALGLTHRPPAPVLDPSCFAQDTPDAVPAPGPFTIVMPVHNAFDDLREALDRVARHTAGDWRMILIDDASDDPRVVRLLGEWSAGQGGRVDLVTLERNVGFVAAVNLALDRVAGRDGHVVLLNSDAFVPAGWADRLLAPLEDRQVASVTPFSDAAEIFSVPHGAGRLQGDLADRIDAVARDLCLPRTLPPAPTGVGFCMAMSRHWLARVPRLDPAFGRGYGEEVDWCQRVRALGARHVGHPGLFVRHAGGSSFGADKPRRVVAANARISARYPRYNADVQRYIRHDPQRTERLALTIAGAGFAARGALPVYLAHSLGGGADLALEREIDRDLRSVGAAVVVRVGGTSRFVVEAHLPSGRLDGATASFALVRALLRPVPRLRIVYSCGVGDPAAWELPGLLASLRRDVLRDRLEARIHDYFPVSPAYCLLGRDGRFRGVPDAETPDPAHRFRDRNGHRVGLGQWRDTWRGYLASCDEITAFSEAAARIVRQAYPTLSHRVTVRPPGDVMLPGRVVPTPSARAIGILGNLNAQKGVRIVADMARRLETVGDTRPVVVIGNADARFPLPRRVTVHGGYARDRIGELTRRYGISAWVVPAIWPETYSFATREALATGLPVIAFDIGAQGEAVRAAVNGHAVPYDAEADLAGRLLEALPRERPVVVDRSRRAPLSEAVIP
jgi:GT2 family glycosyltransferase